MRLLKIIWRFLDLIFKFLFNFLFFLLLFILKFYFLITPKDKKKSTICILKRYQDTIDRHQKSNASEYLKILFKRDPFKYVYVLCVGDGKNRIIRWSNNVIQIDINISTFSALAKIFPHLTVSIRNFLAFLRTACFLRNKNIGIIENDFPNNLVFRCIYLKIALSVRLVTKVIGNIDLIFSQTLFPIFFPFKMKGKFGVSAIQLYDYLVSFLFFKSCSLIIGANKDNMDNALAKGANPQNTYLLRIKVDQNITTYPVIERRNLIGFPKDGRIILLWSRIAPEMMIDRSLLAITPILKEKKDVHFVIIGTGSEVEKIKQLGIKNGVEAQLHLVGYQNRQYIKSAVMCSDLILSPYGGSSLVEAGLLKAPVVAFEYEWQNELILDYVTGLLADFRSADDIMKKVKYMLEQPKEAKKFGEQLYSVTSSMFDINAIEDKSRYIYGQIS
ncbi:MAG: group 1 glycosyl transferase [uncultured bacterium]|nr:MAG: group 1 glycosyl transferase [uncultured bacterium]